MITITIWLADSPWVTAAMGMLLMVVIVKIVIAMVRSFTL